MPSASPGDRIASLFVDGSREGDDAMARRSYGTGSLYVRADSAGRESWYGQWRSSGRRVKRCVGLVRMPGSRDGLTRTQAEAKLRQLMAETPVARPASERLTLAEVAPRYVDNLKAKGRKPSTIVADGSASGVMNSLTMPVRFEIATGTMVQRVKRLTLTSCSV